ncbi:Protein CBG27162 [Caenorhabditis briggsae]|uniref:Protein CBG27162 n=1 Tax=Caenorhabditis briggsae TaxID=6238 RepID=B6IL71_CAEBR|nr:Protein CBG27162 [Caenorhabditis briggsae]CAS00624.1 Protein CBG27162 [Caenorhabditis briggsae]
MNRRLKQRATTQEQFFGKVIFKKGIIEKGDLQSSVRRNPTMWRNINANNSTIQKVKIQSLEIIDDNAFHSELPPKVL